MVEIEKREEELRARLAAEPLDEESLRALADLIGRGRGRKAEAVELWERYVAVVAGSRIGEALLRLARAQVEARREAEAIATLKRSIAEDRSQFAAFELLGELLRRSGRLEQAVSAFREASELDAAAVEPRLSLLACLDALGRSEEAEAELDAVRALGQDDPAVAALAQELMQRRD